MGSVRRARPPVIAVPFIASWRTSNGASEECLIQPQAPETESLTYRASQFLDVRQLPSCAQEVGRWTVKHSQSSTGLHEALSRRHRARTSKAP